MLVGELAALLTRETLPLTVLFDEGAKVTVNPLDCPAANVSGKESPLMPNPLPFTFAWETVRLAFPVLLIVAVRELEFPIATSPKSMLLGFVASCPEPVPPPPVAVTPSPAKPHPTSSRARATTGNTPRPALPVHHGVSPNCLTANPFRVLCPLRRSPPSAWLCLRMAVLATRGTLAGGRRAKLLVGGRVLALPDYLSLRTPWGQGCLRRREAGKKNSATGCTSWWGVREGLFSLTLAFFRKGRHIGFGSNLARRPPEDCSTEYAQWVEPLS